MISQVKKEIAGKKAYVGMSGGVDSSVSAALLKADGYDVTGVFIKVWQPDEELSGLKCTWREDRLDAMRAAAVLDIPFVTLDLEREYKQEVVDYMIAEYRAGRTPNPDVMCNKSVKFGAFYDWAMENGADFVATGHYAKIVRSAKLQVASENGGADKGRGNIAGATGDSTRNFSAEKYPFPETLGLRSSNWQLLAGDDKNKDQSYFLWNIRPEQLPHILFPVGDIEKPEVRRLARKFKLPNADKKDSQGLCFIGKVDIKQFLSHYIEPKKGDVLNEQGNVIGHHDGAVFLTLGERHGFIIDDKTPHDQPYFVIAKDVAKNTVTVSHKNPEGLLSDARANVSLEKTNWLIRPEIGKKYFGRARYRQELQGLTFTSIKEGKANIEFSKPQNALTPGQSLVVYDGDVCVLGGIIS